MVTNALLDTAIEPWIPINNSRKPFAGICKQIVELDTPLDGILVHLYDLVNLLHSIPPRLYNYYSVYNLFIHYILF